MQSGFQKFEPLVGTWFECKQPAWPMPEHYNMSIQRQISLDDRADRRPMWNPEPQLCRATLILSVGNAALCLSLAPACGPN